MVDRKSGQKRGGTTTKGFTKEEIAAMREHAKEMRSRQDATDREAEVLAKIAEMPPSDRAIAERLHALIKVHAPGLTSRTWYGMPAYSKDGEILCFFQCADKFKARYATLGFSDEAKLDHGRMWPVVFALTDLTDVEEAQIVALLAQAIG